MIAYLKQPCVLMPGKDGVRGQAIDSEQWPEAWNRLAVQGMLLKNKPPEPGDPTIDDNSLELQEKIALEKKQAELQTQQVPTRRRRKTKAVDPDKLGKPDPPDDEGEGEGTGETETPGWATVNLRCNFRVDGFGTKHILTAGVDNLLDKTYRNHLSTSRGTDLNESGLRIYTRWAMEF